MALDFIAGCLGGCAGVLVGHPFDTVKVRLQTQDFRNPQYNGTVHCFRTIVQKESVAGLYRGVTSPIAGVSAVNAIVFGAHGALRRRLENPDSLTSHFVAGAGAGLAQSVVCSPVELVKTRMQLGAAAPEGGGAARCLLHIARTGGIRALFRGLGITTMREVPGFGIYFVTYEWLTRSPTPISTVHMLLAGGMSGTLSWVATYPIDVIKSRIQADGASGQCRYRGIMDCLRQSVQTEGYACLSRGLSSTILRAFPTNAATFAVVTWVFRLAESPATEPTTSNHLLMQACADSIVANHIQLSVKEDPLGIKVSSLFHPKNGASYFKSMFEWRRTLVDRVTSNAFVSFDVADGFGATHDAAPQAVETVPAADTKESGSQPPETSDGHLVSQPELDTAAGQTHADTLTIPRKNTCAEGPSDNSVQVLTK